jgi:hypothetical protein
MSAQSKLEIIVIDKRNALLPKNNYNSVGNNQYTAGHTRALSDTVTPEAGRGTGGDLDSENYATGTRTDIDGNPSIPGSGRNPAIAKNESTWGYGPKNFYTKPDTTQNNGQVNIS